MRGSFRNLIVAATGTGKTVIAAFDYRRFCKQNPGKANRLLFIAHREEIYVFPLSPKLLYNPTNQYLLRYIF